MSGPVGNVYDKYGTRNPVARVLMAGFLGAVARFCRAGHHARVLEVGCGEGLLASRLLASGALDPQCFCACDLDVVPAPGLDPRVELFKGSIYELPFAERSFDLVLCCEVLEHLEEPRAGLRELARVARHDVIVSTPREPLWRALNLARAKYVADLGNTPGHVQHWGRRGLVRLVQRELTVRDVASPVPWTVVHAQVPLPPGVG